MVFSKWNPKHAVQQLISLRVGWGEEMSNSISGISRPSTRLPGILSLRGQSKEVRGNSDTLKHRVYSSQPPVRQHFPSARFCVSAAGDPKGFMNRQKKKQETQKGKDKWEKCIKGQV